MRVLVTAGSLRRSPDGEDLRKTPVAANQMQQVALGGEGVRIGPVPLNPIVPRSISPTAHADQQLAMNDDQLAFPMI